MMMIPYLSGEQLRAALPFPGLIKALGAAFGDANGAIAPTRHVHQVSPANGTVLLLMPVWQAAANMGVKLVTVAAGNAQRGLPSVHSVFVLFDTESGQPKALLDGEELTLRRTGAASALASGWLSRPDSEVLLVVGTGSLAPYMAAAHCAARPIRLIQVWGRTPENIAKTIAAIRQLGVADTVRIEAAPQLPEAAMQADIITCATTSKTPILLRQWVKPGTHIDLVGGFKPDMREADDELMAASSLFVDTRAGTLAEAGDLLQPIANGRLKQEAILAELADLASGRHPGRRSPTEITVFKSVGTGVEDLAAANLAWSAQPL